MHINDDMNRVETGGNGRQMIPGGCGEVKKTNRDDGTCDIRILPARKDRTVLVSRVWLDGHRPRGSENFVTSQPLPVPPPVVHNQYQYHVCVECSAPLGEERERRNKKYKERGRAIRRMVQQQEEHAEEHAAVVRERDSHAVMIGKLNRKIAEMEEERRPNSPWYRHVLKIMYSKVEKWMKDTFVFSQVEGRRTQVRSQIVRGQVQFDELGFVRQLVQEPCIPSAGGHAC